MVGMFIKMVIKNKNNNNNKIDIIELHNVIKFENQMYIIENKEFELENLVFVTKMPELQICKPKLLNTKILIN